MLTFYAKFNLYSSLCEILKFLLSFISICLNKKIPSADLQAVVDLELLFLFSKIQISPYMSAIEKLVIDL